MKALLSVLYEAYIKVLFVCESVSIWHHEAPSVSHFSLSTEGYLNLFTFKKAFTAPKQPPTKISTRISEHGDLDRF